MGFFSKDSGPKNLVRGVNMKILVGIGVILTLIFTCIIVFTGCGCFMSAAQEHAKRGAELFYEGRFEEAIVECIKAIELDPNLPDGYGIRAWIYNETGQYDLAIPDFTRALELDPDYISDYVNRAQAYINTGQFDLAIADCDEAIRRDSNYDLAYMRRAQAYMGQGKKTEALADCEKVLEITDDPRLVEGAEALIAELSG